MKKARSRGNDELRPEYKRGDFGQLVRGKYAARMRAASNVVVLRPEVAAAFPNGEAVNDALLALIRLAKTGVRPPARASGRNRARAERGRKVS